MFGMFLWLLLSLAISVFNAYSVGRYWTERGQLPGWTRFTMWCGVIMSVAGFFMVFVVMLTMIMNDIHAFEWLAQNVFKMTLEPGDVEALVQSIFDLSYLGLVFPVIGTGLAITVNSWVVAVARRDPVSIGIAVYNTFAQAHNIVSAFRYVPQATKSLSSGLRIRLNKNSGQALAYLALLLFPIVISLGTAIAATVIIMKASDKKFQLEDLAQA